MAWAETVADLTIAAGRALSRALPRRVKKMVEDRIFFAIYQKTRVENDAYGWKPPPSDSAPTDTPRTPPETSSR